MDMNQIKENWLLLDNRLKKTEGLNDRIIKEILMQKSNKSLNRLFNFELFGIAICLIMIPFIFYALSLMPPHIFHNIKYYVLGFTSLLLICISLGFQLYKINLLQHIDLFSSVVNNIKIMQRYNITIRKEKIIILIGSYIVICVLTAILFTFKQVETWRWIVLIITTIGIIPLLAYWEYGKFYKSNIRSIKDSLDELKELD